MIKGFNVLKTFLEVFYFW